MALIKGTKLKMTQVWKENRVIPVTPIKVGSMNAEVGKELEEGKKISISGITKGRGFQGTVKRHGFHGGPKSHGQKDRLRAPGSIGSTAPQRVMKGRKMAGRMGNNRVTVKNLVIMGIDKENGIIKLRGAVPGSINGKVEIRI